MSLELEENIIQNLKCKHCYDNVITPFYDDKGTAFCCQGCRSVYEILHSNGLENFYSIQERTGDYTKAVKNISHSKFSYLNTSDFLKKYSYSKNNRSIMTFYLEGVHCLACLWLIEKLPELVSNVERATLNLGKSLVEVELKAGEQDFSRAASTLNHLGYKPFPISNSVEEASFRKKEDRSLLIKIGIAGAAMMNIMLYSGSIYVGATGSYISYFGNISLLLCLPVVLYSALPFYQSALGALKRKSINIDIPLSLAIIAGFILSTYFVFTGSAHHYFDSLSTLTFLILSSRYLLRKVQHTGFDKKNLASFFQQGIIRRINTNGKIEEIHSDQIKVEDTLVVMPGDIIPADGTLVKGETKLNLSTLTGESIPVLHKKGSFVYMGSLNVGQEIEIKVLAIEQETRLGKILGEVERQNNQKSHYFLLTDRISKYFITAILFLTSISFVFNFLFFTLEESLMRSLALIIVTCPCALGLATPLVFSRIMSMSAKMGIIIKSEQSIEALAKAENLFFDKTGTLTYGDFSLHQVTRSKKARIPYSIEEIVFSLESHSSHPIAKALVNWTSAYAQKTLRTIKWAQYEEHIGRGVRGFYNNIEYEIHSVRSEGEDTTIFLFENQTPLASFILKDQVRKEALPFLNSLRNKKFNLFLSSGDKSPIVEKVAKELSFPSLHVQSELSPEAKAQWIRDYKNAVFIGDGANDTLALSQASASISMHGAAEVSLKSSDAFLYRNDLMLVEHLLANSKQAIRLVKQNLCFSLFYNIVGASLAIFGFIGPLEAAILMPLSSFTVLLNTIYGTRYEYLQKKGVSNGDH